MTQTFIIDAVRSPRGKGNDKGALRSIQPVDLLAQQLEGLQQRTEIDTACVVDGVFGCVTQMGEQGGNIGKLALVRAGWSDAVPGVTINRYCASGLSAVQWAAMQALASDGLAVAGGVEMMSRVPMASDRSPITHDVAFQRQTSLIPMGVAADAIATLEGFSREACDAFAAESQRRAVVARDGGCFASIIPARAADGEVLLTRDETPRGHTTRESLATLAPAFADMGMQYGIDALLCARHGLEQIHHVQHAGNSPAMADGAAAVLVASTGAVQRHGLTPRARILATADAGVDHVLALTGAVDATRRALARAGLSVDEIDLFEVNESFASLMLHYMKHLQVPREKLNVNGGAIALGHAMGSTGSTLVGMALDELERRNARRAVVAICGAAGVAVAMVLERVQDA